MRWLPRPGLLLLAVLLVTPAACRKATPPPAPADISQPVSSAPAVSPLIPAAPIAGTVPELPKGLQLRVEPSVLKLPRGGSARVKLIAVRTGYQGPVSLELGNLPGQVTAVKATLAPADTVREIEVKAA